MISVRGLAHRYGVVEALRLAEWNVAQGERWLVLGPSGCGKTTLLTSLPAWCGPSEGQVEVSGENLGRLDAARLDRWRGTTVGIVLQALHLVKHLSVRDNLRLAQYLAQVPQDDARIADTLGALGVAEKGRGGRASCRRASSSASRSRARWSTARSCCSPTSRPPTSTMRRRRRWWTSFPSRRRATARRWWSPRTTRA